MKIKKLISKRIAKVRQEKELSQEDLAGLSKLNVTYIAKVERGEVNIGLANLYKICTALDITLSEFFKGY